MKRFFSIALILTALVSCSVPAEREAVSVIPLPHHMELADGCFRITSGTPVFLDENTSEFQRITGFLNERLSVAAGFTLQTEQADLRNPQRGIWFLNAGLC